MGPPAFAPKDANPKSPRTKWSLESGKPHLTAIALYNASDAIHRCRNRVRGRNVDIPPCLSLPSIHTSKILLHLNFLLKTALKTAQVHDLNFQHENNGRCGTCTACRSVLHACGRVCMLPCVRAYSCALACAYVRVCLCVCAFVCVRVRRACV